MLYTDIPTETELRELDAARGEICVSIYLPTTPVTKNAQADRIVFKNLVSEAIDQLNQAKANKRKLAAIIELLEELHADDVFWAYLADGLAVFANPSELRTFRLPMAALPAVEVSDRFHIKPLVPLFSFSNTCFVLALSQGATRLIEVTSNVAEAVMVNGMPKNMSAALKKRLPRDPAPTGRIQGKEGMKTLTGQYCRIVDRALRPVLAGHRVPLVLACVDELAAIYRSRNNYPSLLKNNISGNPENVSEQDLAAQARDIVAKHSRKIVSTHLKQVARDMPRGLASVDLAEIARAATRGQVDTLLLDVTAAEPGTIDDQSGKVSLDKNPSAQTYDVLDELVGRTLRAGGTVVPASARALGKAAPAAAIFRYAG